MGRSCIQNGKRYLRCAFEILTSTPIGKRPLRRSKRRWESNIRMDLKEIGINTRNWVNSAQGKSLLNCSCEPLGSISRGFSYLKV